MKFLFDDSHFNVPWKTVNQAAFKPSNKTRNISIYRTQGLEDGETFEIGHQYVTELRADKKPILAAACLQANIYLEEKLSFDPDGKPHPRHSNVNGWPWDKDVQRELRITLARKSCLLLPT